MKTPLLPSPSPPSTIKLFITGATVGPIVDSLHNQSLLQYDRAPINLFQLSSPSPQTISSGDLSSSLSSVVEVSSDHYIFCSSWYIPLLLGVAYVVLGDLLPNFISMIIKKSLIVGDNHIEKKDNDSIENQTTLRNKALLAVTTTAFIIKLSDYLQMHPYNAISNGHNDNVVIMTMAALTQWVLLDGTLASFITALFVSIGGPLSELPFVANGFWHYIPNAADYIPFQTTLKFLNNLGGDGWILKDYNDLALSSITGPCYFAVTMDAIALGRWFKYCDQENIQ